MSVIFGIRKAEEQTVEERQLLELARGTDRYAPDGTVVRASGRIGMGFQPYHTHERSHLESRPMVDACSNMLTLDGRLDNHTDLCKLLNLTEACAADSLIVLAAFAHWGEDCFSRFIGDWALALWSHADQTLYLARDHAGTRTLYFKQIKDRILWSTFLETFFTEGESPDLDEGFAACYLACQPVRNLTPYQGIRAVPPAHYLKFRESDVGRRAHWQWMVKDEIRYQTNTAYEEHFLSLFRQSVERRTGPGAPLLAELSGGMDSTSIVCMSDRIRRDQGAIENIIATISYHDDSEPNWDEKPYFSAVEAGRGKSGIHIETSSRHRTYKPVDSSEAVYLFPGIDSATITNERSLLELIADGNYKVILSGVGGDEVLGGVPSPFPELANHLVSGRIDRLVKQALEWCLTKRTPLMHMLLDTAKFTVNLYQDPHGTKTPPWLDPDTKRIASDATRSDAIVQSDRGLLPAAISNGHAWWAIMETLPHLLPGFLKRYEYRYPYLDRELVEFLFRIPREQLVGPGRRRHLMRRALKGIVPNIVLERRRKAYISRGPLIALQGFREQIDALLSDSMLAEHGWVDVRILRQALEDAVSNSDPIWMVPIIRTISFEIWLRSNRSRFSAQQTGNATYVA